MTQTELELVLMSLNAAEDEGWYVGHKRQWMRRLARVMEAVHLALPAKGEIGTFTHHARKYERWDR